MDFVCEFVVVRKNRNSKARYAEGVNIGDRIKAVIKFKSTTGASNGLYALTVQLFRHVDNEFVHFSSVSQNEFTKGYTTDLNNEHSVFLVESIS